VTYRLHCRTCAHYKGISIVGAEARCFGSLDTGLHADRGSRVIRGIVRRNDPFLVVVVHPKRKGTKACALAIETMWRARELANVFAGASAKESNRLTRVPSS
jgi:hypothetical protein